MLLLTASNLFLECIGVLEVGVVLQYGAAVISVARELALEVVRRSALEQVAASWFLLKSFLFLQFIFFKPRRNFLIKVKLKIKLL